MTKNIEINMPVLQLSGSAVTEGSCTSMEGNPVDFTEPLMQKILSHVDKPIPIGIMHDNDVILGFAPKVGYNATDKTIPFNGYVFDIDKRKIIEAGGFNKISPEITFFKDSNDNIVDGVITALKLVKTPAMEGTQITCSPMKFSAPIDETGDLGSENNMVKSTDGVMVFYPQGVPSGTIQASNFESEKNTLTAKIEHFEAENAAIKTDLETFKNQITTLTNEKSALEAKASDYEVKYNGLNEKYNGIITEKVNTVIEDLKKLGFKDPEIIGKDLPAEQRILVMNQMKENMVIGAPGTSPTDSIETKDPKKLNKEALLDKMGISNDMRQYINK